MIRRDCAVSARIGVALDPSRACRRRMDLTLEWHLGLQRSACVRDVLVGADQPLAREARSPR